MADRSRAQVIRRRRRACASAKTGADCNGKTASVFGLNDITHLAIMNWVDRNGGDSKTMKFVEIPNSAAGAALAEHRTDMTTLNEPQLTAAIETGSPRAFPPREMYWSG